MKHTALAVAVFLAFAGVTNADSYPILDKRAEKLLEIPCVFLFAIHSYEELLHDDLEQQMVGAFAALSAISAGSENGIDALLEVCEKNPGLSLRDTISQWQSMNTNQKP